jgi:hypothetical protein
MREAIDFLNDKLGVREKLIQSARQFSEKNGAQKFTVTIKRFEDLYTGFLRLYQPILDKIAGHKEAIQKDIVYQRDSLAGVLGMIQVARGVDVLADRLRELEAEAKVTEAAINEKAKTIEKIDDLLSRTRRQTSDAPRQSREENLNDNADQSDDFMIGLRETGTKSETTRKTGGR